MKKRKRGEVSVKFDTKPETQWEEATRMILEIRDVRDAHERRLLELLGINQNPGCGGDDSIDEDRWDWLRNSMRDLGILPL
jgi:hypothetical protein